METQGARAISVPEPSTAVPRSGHGPGKKSKSPRDSMALDRTKHVKDESHHKAEIRRSMETARASRSHQRSETIPAVTRGQSQSHTRRHTRDGIPIPQPVKILINNRKYCISWKFFFSHIVDIN